MCLTSYRGKRTAMLSVNNVSGGMVAMGGNVPSGFAVNNVYTNTSNEFLSVASHELSMSVARLKPLTMRNG